MNNHVIFRDALSKFLLYMALAIMSTLCIAESEVVINDTEVQTVMMLEKEVRTEIEEMHQFFVVWFNGHADQPVFDAFSSRFDSNATYIGADGSLLDRTALVGFLGGARGVGSDFAIAIRDVKVLHVSDSHVIATYTEWQRRATHSDRPESGRLTTVVLSNSKPFRWIHIHETWLPEAISKAGPYNF